MNKEIKEILDRLDYNEWEVDLYKVPITWCEMYDIRDYITNLQKGLLDIKEYANNRLDYYEEMRRDYMKEFDGYAENDNENILNIVNKSIGEDNE